MRLLHALPLLVIPACNAPPPKSSPALVAVGPAARGGAAADSAKETTGRDVVVVRASRAASRRPSRGRVVRRLLSERRGNLELPKGYAELGLIVERVVSGKLEDPSFAQRPIGINVLDVVVVDEAAYAMPPDLEGFEGEWRLARTAEGDLVAASIKDTPFPEAKAADRERTIELARKKLHADAPDDRLEGIKILGEHAFYALVPDLIALVDDERPGTPIDMGHMKSAPVVRYEALTRLRQLTAALGMSPPRIGDRELWAAFWRTLVKVGPGDKPQPIASTRVNVIDAGERGYIGTQEAAATSSGSFAWPATDLAQPIEGRKSGLLLFRADGTKSWLAEQPDNALALAGGPSGVGFVHANHMSAWSVGVAAVGSTTPAKAAATIAAEATHVGFGAGKQGFASIHTQQNVRALFVTAYDASGKARKPAGQVPLPNGASAMTSYHRGVYPLAFAGMKDGWLAAVETSNGLMTMAFDGSLGLRSSATLAQSVSLANPKIAVHGDQAFVVWRQREDEEERLGYALVDAKGQLVPDSLGATNDEISDTSAPVALDDGSFALAWIESRSELRVGRWNPNGAFVKEYVLQAQTHSEGPVLLGRDGADLVVAFSDKTRWPFSVALRRLPVSALR